MTSVSSYHQRCALVTILGAIAVGLVVVLATKAIPKIVSQVMAGMMKNMMAQMREGGGTPSEI